MNKSSLTLDEAKVLRTEMIAANVTITKPIVEIPEGIYGGKFLTQKKDDKTLHPVIDYIEYARDNKPMGFFVAKANIANETKSYSNVNIGLTDELEIKLSNPTDLVRDYDFHSKQGRTRTFVSVDY